MHIIHIHIHTFMYIRIYDHTACIQQLVLRGICVNLVEEEKEKEAEEEGEEEEDQQKEEDTQCWQHKEALVGVQEVATGDSC